MNEKVSTILTTQGRQLKRLGIYTAIVLVIFTGFIAFLGIEMKKEQAQKESGALSPAAVEASLPDVVPTDSTLKETVVSKEIEKKTAPVPASREIEKTTQLTNTNIKSSSTFAAVNIKGIHWPARGKIIRNFGTTYSQTFSDYRFHKGVDIELQRGAEVMTVLDGKVIGIETAKGEKGLICIDHGQEWQSIYAHLNEIYVQPGEKVKQGQAIGSVDQPGLNEVLEGPHLHFELRKEGKEVNPLDYLP